MKAIIDNRAQIVTGGNISIKCPHCGSIGTFSPVTKDVKCNDIYNDEIFIGLRKCPNLHCNGHIFIIQNSKDELLDIHPSISIDFNTDNIPNEIVSTFKEAIVCHSNTCYIASAIMVRKTLEQLCKEKGAVGHNLKERLKALVETITMPQALKDGMDILRVLGNNAAHVELTDFDEIGKEELEISIEFTKEILKSVYQFDKLLMSLQALKKT